MDSARPTQTLYILTDEDGERIDHLLGVLATAVAELLAAKRVKVSKTPDLLPAEDQLLNETNAICGGDGVPPGADSGDF